jgi:hypothetical protein
LAAHPGKAAEFSKRWRDKNPASQSKADANWYASNRDRKLAADKARREKNHAEFLARERASYLKHKEARAVRLAKWHAKNPGKINTYAAKRRSSKADRTPPWLASEQHEQILAFYTMAVTLSNSGESYHVDHIIPLRGRTVSGLHVPWNLQVLTQTDNLKKNNHFDTAKGLPTEIRC